MSLEEKSSPSFNDNIRSVAETFIKENINPLLQTTLSEEDVKQANALARFLGLDGDEDRVGYKPTDYSAATDAFLSGNLYGVDREVVNALALGWELQGEDYQTSAVDALNTMFGTKISSLSDLNTILAGEADEEMLGSLKGKSRETIMKTAESMADYYMISLELGARMRITKDSFIKPDSKFFSVETPIGMGYYCPEDDRMYVCTSLSGNGTFEAIDIYDKALKKDLVEKGKKNIPAVLTANDIAKKCLSRIVETPLVFQSSPLNLEGFDNVTEMETQRKNDPAVAKRLDELGEMGSYEMSRYDLMHRNSSYIMLDVYGTSQTISNQTSNMESMIRL